MIRCKPPRWRPVKMRMPHFPSFVWARRSKMRRSRSLRRQPTTVELHERWRLRAFRKARRGRRIAIAADTERHITLWRRADRSTNRSSAGDIRDGAAEPGKAKWCAQRTVPGRLMRHFVKFVWLLSVPAVWASTRRWMPSGARCSHHGCAAARDRERRRRCRGRSHCRHGRAPISTYCALARNGSSTGRTRYRPGLINTHTPLGRNAVRVIAGR